MGQTRPPHHVFTVSLRSSTPPSSHNSRETAKAYFIKCRPQILFRVMNDTNLWLHTRDTRCFVAAFARQTLVRRNLQWLIYLFYFGPRLIGNELPAVVSMTQGYWMGCAADDAVWSGGTSLLLFLWGLWQWLKLCTFARGFKRVTIRTGTAPMGWLACRV